jgi:hypothetical protein
MRLNLLQFTRLLQGAKRLHAKIVPFMPPLSLTLQVDALAFQRKEIWTIPEAQVIAGVAEYQLVRDILNYCPLPDLEIYETLINLRKQGLLRPIKAPVKQRREI